MVLFDSWKQRIESLKRETHALYLAVCDPRTPWYAKALAACVVAYALSPIDLIPDPIPVLGQLDDLILVPFGIALVRRLIPSEVLEACRRDTQAAPRDVGRLGRLGATFVLLVWVILLALAILWIWR